MKKHYFFVFFSILLLSSFSQYGWSQSPPVLDPINDQTARLGILFTYDVNAQNANPAESYELLEALPGMTINSSTGVINWIPTDLSDGGKVEVRAFNTEGESVESFLVYLYNDVSCPNGLISYWKLDEASGTTFADYYGGYNAVSANPVSTTTGIVDSAVSLQPLGQTDQHLSVADNNQYEFNRDENFSISLWFKYQGDHIGNSNNQVLIGRGAPSGENSYLALYVDNKTQTYPTITFELKPNSVDPVVKVNFPKVIVEDEWTYVSVVYRGAAAGVESYIVSQVNNQKNSYNRLIGTGNFTGNYPFNIGYLSTYSTNTYPFNGYIDEVMVYDIALSNNDLDKIYADGLANNAQCQPINHYPLVTSVAIDTATQDELYYYEVTGSDFDGDDIVLSEGIMPSWLSFDANTGILTGTPLKNDVSDTLVRINISDGSVQGYQEFTLTVKDVNDPPEFTSLPSDTIVNEDETFSYVVEAVDYDPGDEITLEATVLPSWMTFNPATGLLEGTPTNDQVMFSPDSLFDVELIAFDLSEDTTFQNFTIRVVNVNDPPLFLSQLALNTDRNTALELTLDDFEVEDPDDVYPDDHELVIYEGDDYSFIGDTITPAPNFYGTIFVNAGISDGSDTVNYLIEITVNYTNAPPEFTSEPVTNAHEGDEYTYIVTATDPDVDDPDVTQAINITAETIPAWLTFDAGTNTLSGTPAREDHGENEVRLKVTDGELNVYQDFVIFVTSTNNPPEITSTPPLEVDNYVEYAYTVTATDVDPDDELTYAADVLPSWLTFDPETQVLSGIPEKADVGENAVVIIVSDSYDETVQEFTIMVQDVNTAPVVVSVPEDTIEANNTYSYLLEIVDNEDDAVDVIVVSLPTWLDYNPDTKIVSGVPTTDNIGEHTVILTITDGEFSQNFQFNISVINPTGIDLIGVIGKLASSIYPNPATDFVMFELASDSPVNIEISDITGKVVLNKKLERNVEKFQLDISGLDKGIYIYKLSNDEGKQAGRIIKR